MAQGYTRRQGFWRKAWQWDRSLPRPMVLLLLIDLLLLLPIPILLLRPAEAGVVAATERYGPLAPLLVAEPQRPGNVAVGDSLARPLLIDRERYQDAGGATTNAIADLIAAELPAWSSVRISVGAGMSVSVAEAVMGQALRWNINPRLLLSIVALDSVTMAEPISGGVALAPPTGELLSERILWHALELRAGLSAPIAPSVRLRDGSRWSAPTPLGQADYALVQVLAQTQAPADFRDLLAGGWLEAARPFLGDPRRPVAVSVRDQPFLRAPFAGERLPIARFDHHYPLVEADGAMVGGDSLLALGYDGHNGWDYELEAGTELTAPAAGVVLFAGWIDSGCATPAGVVVIDHQQGYRSSLWHLEALFVGAGDSVAVGEPIGLAGGTGCTGGAHLHFSVQRLGRDIDPWGWCEPVPDPWAAHPAGAPSQWLWLDHASPCDSLTGALIADEQDQAAVTLSAGPWRRDSSGNFGGSMQTTVAAAGETLARWRPALGQPGTYRLLAFVPGGAAEGGVARYEVSHAGGLSSVEIEQGAHAGSWVVLGSYRFLPGQRGSVTLSGAAEGSQLWVDAIAWLPLEP